MLTVLSVAYPLAPVTPDAIGGAEQVLARVEAGLAEAGCRSLVLAAPGSRVRGTLYPSAPVPDVIDEGARRQVWEAHRRAIARLVDEEAVDVVHLHGIDFLEYLPPPKVPTLATLHLPLSWYPREVLALQAPTFALNCVSAPQRALGGSAWAALPVIENGIAMEATRPPFAKRGYAMALGRICPEKGFHDAVEAAKRADVPLVLGGQVFPYPVHEAYFRDELRPALDARRRFVGPLRGRRKARLLASARCLVVPSLVEETCSLVALEALAAGTPVVARRRGALVDIVDDGVTGFLVDDVDRMAEGIRRAASLDPAACHAAAAARWTIPRMIDGYRALYELVAGAATRRAEPAAPLRSDEPAPLETRLG